MEKEYREISEYYDLLHNEKDYQNEVNFLTELIHKYKKSKGNRLLDIACGTGNHILYFKKNFKTSGIDLSSNLIKIARKKNPEIEFKISDMRKFKSGKKYDIVTILFSSIAYIKTKNEIVKLFGNIYKILNKGGILIIETLYLRDIFNGIKNHIRKYSNKDLSMKRIANISEKRDFYEFDAKYEIQEKEKPKKSIYDKHLLKAWTKSELKSIIEDLGFEVNTFDYENTGTKIFVCVKGDK